MVELVDTLLEPSAAMFDFHPYQNLKFHTHSVLKDGLYYVLLNLLVRGYYYDKNFAISFNVSSISLIAQDVEEVIVITKKKKL